MIGRSWRSLVPSLVAVAIVLGVFVWPARQISSDAERRRDAAEAQLAELEVRALMLTSLAQEADGLAQQLLVLDTLVPPAAELPAFVVEMDRIADDLGVDLREVVPVLDERARRDDVGTPAGWQSGEISVRIVGTYGGLMGFVEAIAHADRLAVIDELMVTTAGEGELVGDLRLRLFTNDHSSEALIARYVDWEADR